jgi:hypothetical protein
MPVQADPMKTGRCVAVLVCATSFLAAQNYANSGARSSVLALEYAWDQAQQRGDINALGAIFDNSLVFVDYDGKILTKPEYLARVKIGCLTPAAHRNGINERPSAWKYRHCGRHLPGEGCRGWEAIPEAQAFH